MDNDNSSLDEEKRGSKTYDIIKRMIKGHRKKESREDRETYRQ